MIRGQSTRNGFRIVYIHYVKGKDSPKLAVILKHHDGYVH